MSNLSILHYSHIVFVIFSLFYVVLTYFCYFIVEKILDRQINKLIIKKKVAVELHNHEIVKDIIALVPLFSANYYILHILAFQHFIIDIFLTLLHVVISIYALRLLLTVIDIIHDLLNEKKYINKYPVKSFIQLLKIFIIFLAIIIIIAIVFDRSPVYFLSGLGVAAGFIIIIFKDTILSFIAGIQLSANKMINIGDWIEMLKYNADGHVIEISLTTIKVQNFDKTITMIPAYALITDSFKNWHGMYQAKGRRIKRSILIDLDSIHFVDYDLFERLLNIGLLTEYLSQKKESHYFSKTDSINTESLPQLTNIGCFRQYLKFYLQQNEHINQNLMLTVRQLEPTEKGLPLEIYCFANETSWIMYEDVQSNIFDHALSVIGDFNLRSTQILTNLKMTRSLKNRHY